MKKLKESSAGLVDGVQIAPVYDRRNLIERARRKFSMRDAMKARDVVDFQITL